VSCQGWKARKGGGGGGEEEEEEEEEERDKTRYPLLFLVRRAGAGRVS
jgi:hypothetical protein